MGYDSTLASLLFQAKTSKYGIEVTVAGDRNLFRNKLYTTRLALKMPELNSLQMRFHPSDKSKLLIVHGDNIPDQSAEELAAMMEGIRNDRWG